MSFSLARPPLNEVVIGVYFREPLQALQHHHIGLLWTELRSEFESVNILPEIIVPGTNALSFFGDLPLQRYRFSGVGGPYSIQVQRTGFLLGWTKGDAPYAHFAVVKSEFDRYLAKFYAFVSRELGVAPPEAVIGDVTYANVINPSEAWRGLNDTSRIFPSFGSPLFPVGARQPAQFNYTLAESDGSAATIISTLRTHIINDPVNQSLVFELRYSGAIEDAGPAALDAWLANAHIQLDEKFLAVTSEAVRAEVWGEKRP